MTEIPERPEENVEDQYDEQFEARMNRFRMFVDELAPAKAHFQESGRQFVLGMGAVMQAVATVMDDLHPYPGTSNAATGAILFKSLLDLLAGQIPPIATDSSLHPDEARQAKLEALFNLRAVLQAERERRIVQGTEPDSDAMAILDAVLEAIRSEIDRTATADTAPTPNESSETPSQPQRYEIRIGEEQ